MALSTCTSCGGFVPGARCPHCRGGGVLKILAGAFAMTLMACYGVAPQRGVVAPTDQNGCSDQDGDGACGAQDCNEADKTIFAGAADEAGDGIDQNCDGVDGWRDPDQVATPP